jgi:hypothetical protein
VWTLIAALGPTQRIRTRVTSRGARNRYMPADPHPTRGSMCQAHLTSEAAPRTAVRFTRWGDRNLRLCCYSCRSREVQGKA